jgi:hypothetical protein
MSESEDRQFEKTVAEFLSERLHTRRGLTAEEYTACGFRGMPISVPNYNRKTDRHQFGTLIGITSES